MAVYYSSDRTDAIAQALHALLSEEADLMRQMMQLQSRLEAVRAAASSMRTLVPEDHFATLPHAHLQLFSENPFEGLQFSRALEKYMAMIGEPQTARQIAAGFELSGWKFSGEDEASKQNQVGVTLRRLEGRSVERDELGRWTSIKHRRFFEAS